MAELDIESIGAQLKRIKISQLEPDLLEGVLEIAQEHGYEITITSLSDLHFIFKIYQAEKVRDKRDLKRMKKAENLILRLAGIYSLHHEAQRREEKNRRDEHDKGQMIRRLSMVEENINVGTRMRGLFESVGINDEKDMQQAIGLLGESKIEERISLVKKTILGEPLLKKVFGEHPETIWITKDERFVDELNAMEAKKGIIDAWSGAKSQSPPLWANYNESPSVLLVDFEIILSGLGIGAEEGPPEKQKLEGTPSAITARIVQNSNPEAIYANDPIARAIIRRSGSAQQQAEWLIGGERVSAGGIESDVQTGRILRTIEEFIATMARAGEESDVIVVSGDKRRLNQLNNLLGRENGDLALSAYRNIMRRAVTGAAREGVPFLIRPSQSGDEVIGVIIVRPGEGRAVSERLGASLEKETTAVFNERMKHDHPQSIAHLQRTVRNPRELVSAAIGVGEPVEVRRQADGIVSARFIDGRDAIVTRDDGTREFLPPLARASDDPRFASELRRRTGVSPETEIRNSLDQLERGRVQSVWHRRGEVLSPVDQAILNGIQEEIEGLDAMSPEGVQEALNAVAANRARVDPNEVIGQRSVAFDVRLEITDPSVMTDIRLLLAETGKGLAEVLNNSFGIRGLNTFLGHYGANAVVNRVDAGVGEYASANGLRIKRLGTMKYMIDGGTTDQVFALNEFINNRLDGLSFRVSGSNVARKRIAIIEPGTMGQAALAHVSNGHLVVERRESDWDGEAQRYETANALISAMAIGNDRVLAALLGERYESMRPVIDLVRSRSDIRNFEDLVFALRDETIGGPDGRVHEGFFRSFIVDEGAQFQNRIRPFQRPA